MDLLPVKNEDLMDRLGEDLWVEILHKLPVKSVLRCHSVSKSWNALTKTNYFINRQFLDHRRRCVESRPLFIVSHQASLSLGLINQEFAFLSDEKEKLSLLGSPFIPTNARHTLIFLGSSNGLVCFNVLSLQNLSQKDGEEEQENQFSQENGKEELEKPYIQQTVVIWNPATRKFRILPEPDAKICVVPIIKVTENDIFKIVASTALVCFDFVSDQYDMIISEYKLARIFYHASVDDALKTTFQAQIFDRKTNSWRRGKNELALGFELSRCRHVDQLTLNRFVYWKMWRGENKSWYIMSFNLCEEVFSEAQIPSDVQSHVNDGGPEIFSWRNSLAAATYDKREDSYTLWVIISTNKKTEWNPQFKIKDAVRLKRLNVLLTPTWKDQLIFLSRNEYKDGVPQGTNLFFYNPLTEVQRTILEHAHIKHHSSGSGYYLESLARV